MVTFRKSGNGEWVVCGTVDEVKVGPVRVFRNKDQKYRTVQVGSLGNPFNANGKQMVYGYIIKEEREPAAAPPPPPPVSESDYSSDGDSVPF